MEKSVKLEIENEYKTQISELEENLKQIAEFEASVRPKIGRKMFYGVINFIFATLFILLAVCIVIANHFFIAEFIDYTSQFLGLEGGVPIEGNILKVIQIVMLGFEILFMLLAILLGIIRRKNRVIINIGVIASDFKLRALKMLEVTKERFKNFNRVVADNNKI